MKIFAGLLAKTNIISLHLISIYSALYMNDIMPLSGYSVSGFADLQ